MEVNKTYKILTVLLLMQWAAIKFIAQFPELIEKYYSLGLYYYLSKLFRILLGWIPFSFGDLLYGILILYLIYQIIVGIRRRKFHFKNLFFKFGALLSVVYFLFHLNWGLNYYRQPVIEHFNKSKSGYTVKQLIAFTNDLVQKSNEVHNSISEHDSLIIDYSLDKIELKRIAPKAYEKLQKKHPQFRYVNPSIKHSLFSIPLTYMGFAGYLNPLTNEAQINSLIPVNSYPSTLCHEMAHQIGIASESEANFVGFLATTNASDPYFNYSGYTMALRYCINEIYKYDKNSLDAIMEKLNKGIIKDFRRSQEFWQSYQNKSEKHFKNAYDSYLKANNQKDGIKSYSNIVTLLLRYSETNPI